MEGCVKGFMLFTFIAVACWYLYNFFGPGIIVFFITTAIILLAFYAFVMSADDQSDKNRRPEESDLELAKSLVKKENKKATVWFLLFIVVIAILNVLVALNRNSVSERLTNVSFIGNIFNGGTIDWAISIAVGLIIIVVLLVYCKYISEEDERVKRKVKEIGSKRGQNAK